MNPARQPMNRLAKPASPTLLATSMTCRLEKISVRQVIVENRSHNYMYLPPFPGAEEQLGHYLDFRRITMLPIQYFIAAKTSRLVGLHEEGLNLLYSRLMWFFTRVEYFFHTIECQRCGAEVEIDLRFEGQNVDADPWE
jgi:hypothetical protein